VAGVRRELGLKPGDYGIGVIARLEPQKGHRHLFAAVAALREAIPQLRLVVVGEGSLRASLEQLAQSLQLGSRIVFAGSRRDVPLLNAAMDVIVLPSLWEGLPIALLESMALGRTVIATKVGGVPEVIEHEVNGLLTPPGDALALAAAIQRCWQDRHMAGALASAAFRQVRDKFTIEANAAKVLAVYREQVRGSPEGVPREVPSAGLG